MWRCLRAVLSFLVSLPGLVFSAFVGIVGFVQGLVNNVYGILSSVIQLMDGSIEYVQDFITAITSNQYWGFFYDMFAIDAFAQVFSTFVSLAIVMLVLIVFDFFFQGLVVAVPFLIFKSVGKILQAITAGFAKPT